MTTIPTGYAQVTHIFAGSGVPNGAAVTYGIAANALTTAQAHATEFHDNWGDNIMPVLIQNIDLQQTIVKFGPNATGPTAEAGGVRGGADLSAQAPPQVAYLVTKTTDLGGRRGKGRMFIPGVDETDVDQGGNLLAAKVTALQTGLTTFLARANTWGAPLYLLHEPGKMWVLVGGQPRQVVDPSAPAAPVPTLITGLVAASKVATQRRRLRD